MLTPPLVATVTGSGVMTPAIYSTAADTAEEWDAFRAQSRSDLGDGNYVDVTIPPGTMVIDMGRRIAAFTPSGAAESVDGVGYFTSPTGFPLAWVTAEPSGGDAYVLITGTAGATPGATVGAAIQARQR
jgi:hypothetical protein